MFTEAIFSKIYSESIKVPRFVCVYKSALSFVIRPYRNHGCFVKCMIKLIEVLDQNKCA